MDTRFFMVGGYQFLQADVSISLDHYTFQYTFTDHFGAGIQDANSPLPGLGGLYYLQHNAGYSNNFIPFIWTVSVINTVPR